MAEYRNEMTEEYRKSLAKHLNRHISLYFGDEAEMRERTLGEYLAWVLEEITFVDILQALNPVEVNTNEC